MSELSELKQRHAALWSAGAFEEVAPSIRDVHETLVATLAPRPAELWLDVGCGAGNLAELAAGAGAQVTGIDLSPRLVDVAKERAEAGGYRIEYRVGDAESLDVGDASFDVVVSCFAAIFAPDHDAVARELARVCRPGGRLGLATWTPEGSIGDLFRTLAPFQPPPPPGAGSPLAWGDEEYVREKLGDAFELSIERRISRSEDESLEHAWQVFSTSFGPLTVLLASLDSERRDELEHALLDLMRRGQRPDGRVVEEREYLLVTGIRR